MRPARGGSADGSAAKGDGDTLESGGYHRDDAGNHQQKSSGGVALRISLMLVVVGITALLSQYSYHMEFFRNSNSLSRPSCENANTSSSFHQYMSQTLPSSAKEENIELDKTLRRAVMSDNKTVIITTLNAAWTEPNSIFDLFMESFRIGNGTAHLLDHVVVGAFDQTAYKRCKAERLHCYAVTTKGVDFSGEEVFMSEDYLKMMWRRIDFLRTVLQLGYDFVFTDADVMWLRDPFTKFYPDGDFQIACDYYLGNYTDMENAPNGGFNYVKSNNRTIQFYDYWYNGREYFPGKHDQDVLNMIKFNPLIPRIGLEVRFLNTAYFGGFCQPSEDLDKVITMHANCCIGIDHKMHDLTMLIHDWKTYMALPAHDTNFTTRSWTVPRICG